MKKLSIGFKNSEGAAQRLVISRPHQNLTAEAVRQEAENMAALGLFVKDDVALYTEVNDAKYTETIETKLF